MVVKNGLIAAEGQCRKKPMSEGKQCRKKLEKTSAMTRQLETQVVGPRKQENIDSFLTLENFKIFGIFLKFLENMKIQVRSRAAQPVKVGRPARVKPVTVILLINHNHNHNHYHYHAAVHYFYFSVICVVLYIDD